MPVASDSREWRAAYAAIVVVVFGILLYSLRPVLTPLVLLPGFLFLISPFSGTRSHVVLTGLTCSLGMLWLLDTAGSVLAPFVLALVLAYILAPIVQSLNARRVPRSLAILLLALPVVALLVVGVIFGIPALAEQVQALIAQIPDALVRLAEFLDRARHGVLRLKIPLVQDWLNHWLQTYDTARLTALLQQQQAAIVRRIWGAVLGVGRGVRAIVTILGYVVLTPVLAYYLLRDWPRITASIVGFVPAGRTRLLELAREYDRLLSHYMRGQLLEATLVGVLTWIGLWVLGFPYSGLVGLVAGVFNLVPYLGLVVSLIPATIIALLSGSVLASLGKVAIVFAIVQFIDGSITGPRIVGESVGLHPVWVMLAIAIGSVFFGFVGLLLAVPGAVLVKLVIREGLRRHAEAGVLAQPR